MMLKKQSVKYMTRPRNRTLLLTCVHVILINGLISCDSGSSLNYDTSPSYEQTKMSLEDTELQNPTSFLSSDGTYRKNLMGEWVLEGKISNSATIATYKDVVLTVRFYSKTKTLLGTERQPVYDYFPAGKSKRFKIKTYGYKGTNTIGWEVTDATASR